MKVNLHTLACELARMDGKTKGHGYDESVVGAQTTLKTLGRKLRQCSAPEALDIFNAILARAGKRADRS